RKSFLATLNLNVPAFLACCLYRHQAVLMPDSRWTMRLSTQFILVSVTSMQSIAMPLLMQLLSPLFSPFLNARTDCYDFESLRPFMTEGSCFTCVKTIASRQIVRHTRSSLQAASSMSNTMRAHQKTMTRV
ncbi:hypothetical protein PENTCL1PPCAC_30470, partial [Pristionchus entomophagus]